MARNWQNVQLCAGWKALPNRSGFNSKKTIGLVRLSVWSNNNPQPCLDPNPPPPNQKGMLAKDGFRGWGKCIGKLQPYECSCVVACVFNRDARLCVSACGRLGVTNAQAHLIGRWGVTAWLAKACLCMRVPCEMSKPLACLPGGLIARERAVGCSLGYYNLTTTMRCRRTLVTNRVK